ncbi:MAG TPA: NAD(P)H-dependent oxidoreductase subunit E [Chitinophagaceae bacterium]|nr:NAD(P)H-dependent oxidoreductase subunit E [Chitinophagaceae bacterium]
MKEIKFTEEQMEYVNKLIARYPEGKQKSALIPLLLYAQDVFDGWLDVPVMDYVAELLDILPIEVYEVATFYTMFHMKPMGKYVFDLCQTGPCMVRGSEDIKAHIEKRLGIKDGETTEDGLFSVRYVECLGACGYAPMMQLGKTYREHLTPEKIDDIIEEIRTKNA